MASEITLEKSKLLAITMAMVAIVTAMTSMFVYLQATQRQDRESEQKYERLAEEIQELKQRQKVIEIKFSSLESALKSFEMSSDSIDRLTKDLQTLLERLKNDLRPPSEGKEGAQ